MEEEKGWSVSGPRRARLRRMRSEWGREDVGEVLRAGSGPIVVTCVGLGLLSGVLELAVQLTVKHLEDDAPGFFRGNRHVVWIVPLVNLMFFLVMGLGLALRARLRSYRPSRLNAFLPCFAAILAVLLAVKGLHTLACVALAGGLASRLAPVLRSRSSRGSRLARAGILVLGLLTTGLVAGSIGREFWKERSGLAALSPSRVGAPNVLLIVLDTVRADHLSLYGYERRTSPHLDRLAARGLRFDHARSTAPWTLPSHASLFTGRWAHELSAGLKGPLNDADPTLAEVLKDRGYTTAGFVSNTTYVSAETGLARGFLHYEDHILDPRGLLRSTSLGKRLIDPLLTEAQKLTASLGFSWFAPGNGKAFKNAATINSAFLDWLPATGDRPFFAFLNYFDAHHPYVVPKGFERHFGTKPESRQDELTLHRWWSLDKRKASSRDLALARDGYDDCLAYLDEQLGELFSELDTRGLLDETIILVTSDHGEHLGEHELFGHASSLYGPEVHVPLVLVAPGRVPSGTSVAQTVSLRDIPATLLELVDGKAAEFPGRSLSRFWKSAATSEPVLSEVDDHAKGPANGGRSPVFRGPMKAIRAGQIVYIRNGDGREELYDLAVDPGEEHDLAVAPAALPVLERSRVDLENLLRGVDRP